MTNPHDTLFKAAFADPLHAAGIFRHALPPEVVGAIDWPTLHLRAGSFVDRMLAEHHTDLLFTARFHRNNTDRLAWLYLLLEHKSHTCVDLPMQILIYLTKIWDRFRREESGTRYPLILPVVVCHGPAAASSPTHFHQLFINELQANPSLSSFVPAFSLALDDLNRASDADIRSRAMAAFPKLALWVLRDGREAGKLMRNIVNWRAAFRDAVQAPSGIEAVAQVFRYIQLVCDSLRFEEFRGILATHVPETERAMATIAQEIQTKTGIKFLRLVLGEKFGHVPPSVESQIESSSLEELENYVIRTMSAKSIDEVFRH